MAFDLKVLKFIGGFDNDHFGGRLFSYSHPTDSLSTMLVPDYFLVFKFDHRDIMLIVHSTGFTLVQLMVSSYPRSIIANERSAPVPAASVPTVDLISPTVSMNIEPDFDVIQVTTLEQFIALTLNNGEDGQLIRFEKVDNNNHIINISASNKLQAWPDFTLDTSGDNVTLLYSADL